MFKKRWLSAAIGVALCSPAFADDSGGACGIPAATVTKIQNKLASIVLLKNGGIFGMGGLFPTAQNFMWSAVVDRQGRLCSVIKTGDAWPGSREIAIAKAGTANDFSNASLPLSTANLYAATQPGGSLWGLNNSNPFNPDFLAPGSGANQFAGGIITFGGGVPLYQNGAVIGGLGVSGDSSCTDHVIAYRMRRAAGFAPTIPGVGYNNTDNIAYPTSGSPAGFQQPHCFPGQDLDPSKI
ncbi:MAG TPA: heme-binding protein [Methylocella sp.]|nr:heme-binding protein [Methylocella sp.]